jgi:hypothetical protein
MCESDLTLNPTKAKQKRWNRPTITAKIAAFQNRPSKTISQRQFANEQGMPRTTLQYWLARKDSIDADPALTAFFESPIGLAFLHRLQVAAHLVFNQVGPCGIRLICSYLELTGLDRFVAASVGAQHQIARQMESEIIAYGAREKSRLANTMPAKKITVCEDETFHPEVCLVAIEPVSDFILVEKYAQQRDAETWNQAIKQATKDLPVEVIQSTSDEATGILSHVREGLGAQHSPDVFHGQRELHKATSLPLRAQVAAATEAVASAEKQRQQAEEEFKIFLSEPPKRGLPPDFPKRIDLAKEREQQARQTLEAAETRRERTRAAIRGISEDYHPYDLNNGRAMSALEIEQRLKERFAQIDQAAAEAQLSKGSQKRIEKARRLIEGFVATVAFFHLQVQMWVKDLALSSEVEQTIFNQLIPALYLERAVKKLPTAEERAKARSVYEPLLSRARGPDSALAVLSDAERVKVERVAQECADLFQRSSSCVEGRNGQLALRHHSLHRLSERKLTALTVIHNYYLVRTEGTTAAERFFGAKPTNLFTWLLDHLKVPARPAAKRSGTVRKAA